MEISRYLNSIVYFLKDHPVFAAMAALIVLALLYAKPGAIIKGILLLALIAGVLYAVYFLTSVGVTKKKGMIEKPSVPGNSTSSGALTQSIPMKHILNKGWRDEFHG